MRLLSCVCLLLLLASCDGILDLGCGGDRPSSQFHRVSITEGVAGQVWFWRGDFMPGCPSGTIRGVKRTVFVYELTHRDETASAGPGEGAFVTAIATAVVDSVQSDSRGFFELRLPPGRYSLFVREGERFYANGWDGPGYVQPVEVQRGSVTPVQLDLTYEAAY